MPIPDDATEEALEKGLAAASLLTLPSFMDAVRELVQQHTDAMVATKEGPPGDSLRSHHHRMIYAIHEIVAQLNAKVNVADVLQRQLDAEQQDETDELPELDL